MNTPPAGPDEAERVVPSEVAAFGNRVADHLDTALDGALVGAYFVGSIALGGYIAGQSDVDIVGVSEHHVPPEHRQRMAAALLAVTGDCPARGLELTLYRREVAASVPAGADFELNVNGGPGMARSVHLDATREPGFWYVLDRAIAHRSGIAIVGPTPSEVFVNASRAALLRAMSDAMLWHRQHEGATLYSVLNACRAWRFAEENLLGSKLEGATWARSRWPQPQLIDSAVALRLGDPAGLDPHLVDELLLHVENLVRAATAD